MVSGVGFELYQNIPNPFINKTSIGFHLPAPAEARLEIIDEAGRLLYQQWGQFDKGYNAFTIDNKMVNTKGVLYYKVISGVHSASLKMIKVD
jgi:hypothetical protein